MKPLRSRCREAWQHTTTLSSVCLPKMVNHCTHSSINLWLQGPWERVHKRSLTYTSGVLLRACCVPHGGREPSVRRFTPFGPCPRVQGALLIARHVAVKHDEGWVGLAYYLPSRLADPANPSPTDVSSFLPIRPRFTHPCRSHICYPTSAQTKKGSWQNQTAVAYQRLPWVWKTLTRGGGR